MNYCDVLPSNLNRSAQESESPSTVGSSNGARLGFPCVGITPLSRHHVCGRPGFFTSGRLCPACVVVFFLLSVACGRVNHSNLPDAITLSQIPVDRCADQGSLLEGGERWAGFLFLRRLNQGRELFHGGSHNGLRLPPIDILRCRSRMMKWHLRRIFDLLTRCVGALTLHNRNSLLDVHVFTNRSVFPLIVVHHLRDHLNFLLVDPHIVWN